MKGVTKSGFEYEIDEAVGNDYEILEIMAGLEDNFLNLFKLVEKLLGKEQTKKLKEHVRNEEGIVPTDKMSEEITEILEGTNTTKNS